MYTWIICGLFFCKNCYNLNIFLVIFLVKSNSKYKTPGIIPSPKKLICSMQYSVNSNSQEVYKIG